MFHAQKKRLSEKEHLLSKNGFHQVEQNENYLIIRYLD